MSDVYLLMAVGGTFVAVLGAGVAVVVAGRARRPSGVLTGQLRSAGVALPLTPEGAFSRHVVAPTATSLASLARTLTPVGARDRVADKLVLAGSPKGWTAERVLAMKGLTTVLGVASGLALGTLTDVRMLSVSGAAALGIIGYLAPGIVLSHTVLARQERVRRQLPDVIDLLTISVEAGLAFDAALLHVRRTMSGPLPQEIGRMLHEVQLGKRRVDALRTLAERTDVSDLRGFVLAMIQADTFGVSITNVLRAQSAELRTKRRQYAEERAMKIPVKLLFPMIFCVMPALFIVIIAPAAIKIYDTLIAGREIF